MEKVIAFLSVQLCERGTTVALFDYADAHEKNGGISLIFYNYATHPDVLEKFTQRFGNSVVKFSDMADVEKKIEELEIDGLYIIKYGNKDHLITNKVPCLIHSVFAYQPHGRYACVSKKIADDHKANWLPHIVHQFANNPEKRLAFRKKYNIPVDAYVYGRHGGKDTFSIDYVKREIQDHLDDHPEFWFVFVNTEKFIVHPRVLFLPTIIDLEEKGNFILGCDAMIHARKEGETFGLAVAEFGIQDKPILTCPATITEDNEHISLGQDRVKVFHNLEELQGLLWQKHTAPNTVNPYLSFSEENVMKKFYQIMFNE